MQIDGRTEWLESDGLGGFASGTTAGIRTRRYHALLLPLLTWEVIRAAGPVTLRVRPFLSGRD